MKWVFVLFLLIAHHNMHAQGFIQGRTTGLLPFLEYGTGDDRLGGAKMTYLDSNVLIKVVDSFQNDYKVQLSAAHFAFLSKKSFHADTALRLETYNLSGSWRVWGDDRFDFLSVSLPERMPYRSLQQVNPSRIIIDLFNVTSNTNWITQLATAKEIKNVWYEQVEDDVLRVFIELKHQQHWGYFISYNKNALLVKVKRQPAKLKIKKIAVAIDAGHGGANSGASGIVSKINEKDYTLMIASELNRLLKRKGAEVYMTRTGDTDLSMVDRTLMLRSQDPHILISIHLNSSGNTAVKGVSTYYRYIGFRSLSQCILNRMLETGLQNFGNIGSFNFSLSGPTEYPNCLVEAAFLSNEEDEKRILDPRFRKKAAKKIYLGIKDWLKLADDQE